MTAGISQQELQAGVVAGLKALQALQGRDCILETQEVCPIRRQAEANLFFFGRAVYKARKPVVEHVCGWTLQSA